MNEAEIEELRQIAAKMYTMIRATFDVYDCAEPSHRDDVCPETGCEGCAWRTEPMLDDLRRLGVDL